MDAPIWDPTVFTKNRERLPQGRHRTDLLYPGAGPGRTRALLSADHFTVDGTLVEVWASHKKLQTQDGTRGAAR